MEGATRSCARCSRTRLNRSLACRASRHGARDGGEISKCRRRPQGNGALATCRRASAALACRTGAHGMVEQPFLDHHATRRPSFPKRVEDEGERAVERLRRSSPWPASSIVVWPSAGSKRHPARCAAVRQDIAVDVQAPRSARSRLSRRLPLPARRPRLSWRARCGPRAATAELVGDEGAGGFLEGGLGCAEMMRNAVFRGDRAIRGRVHGNTCGSRGSSYASATIRRRRQTDSNDDLLVVGAAQRRAVPESSGRGLSVLLATRRHRLAHGREEHQAINGGMPLLEHRVTVVAEALAERDGAVARRTSSSRWRSCCRTSRTCVPRGWSGPASFSTTGSAAA